MKGSTVLTARRLSRGPVALVIPLVVFSLLVPLLLLLLRSRIPRGTADPPITRPFDVQNHMPADNASSPPDNGRVLNQRSDPASVPSRENSSETLYPANDSGQHCPDEFGSYCLWSDQKGKMNDSLVRQLKDQVFIARAYLPIITKARSQQKLYREIRTNILDHERMLGDAITDADLPSRAVNLMNAMEHTLKTARSLPIECVSIDRKLSQILDLTEDEAQFHKRQSAFLYHLGVYTMPKSLHCLLMRLTVEHFSHPLVDSKILQRREFDSPSFQHYVIFSRNILASSVTINSTAVNSKESGNLIFHIVTDQQNYFAMKFWFSENSYKDSVVNVINLEELDISDSYKLSLQRHPSFSDEFRFSIPKVGQASSSESSTEYISVFGHEHFALPEIFKQLKKVVLLEEDVVVQRDLSLLWDLDLDGKVNGAMHFCGMKLAQLKNYLGENKYNRESCIWVSGLNVIDLEKWREHNITAMYEMFLERLGSQSKSSTSWRAAVLPANYLAFQGLTYPLDDSLVLSGLGSKFNLNPDAVQKATVLHYNGNMKPWLDLGIERYKLYWKNFLAQGNLYMEQCNINL